MCSWNHDEHVQTAVQVEFDGLHPIEGAKEVSTVMTRHVSRALRLWSVQQRLNSSEGHHAATAAWKQRIARLASKLPLPSPAMNIASMPPSQGAHHVIDLKVDVGKRTLCVVPRASES